MVCSSTTTALALRSRCTSGLKSSGWNGEGFLCGSRLAFAIIADSHAVCCHASRRAASASQNNSRNVSGPGATPTTPASCQTARQAATAVPPPAPLRFAEAEAAESPLSPFRSDAGAATTSP